jgi:hypothetical protein
MGKAPERAQKMTANFEWSETRDKIGLRLLASWAKPAEQFPGYDVQPGDMVAYALIRLQIEADRNVHRAYTANALKSGRLTPEQAGAAFAALAQGLPTEQSPLGTLQDEAEAVGLGVGYRATTQIIKDFNASVWPVTRWLNKGNDTAQLGAPWTAIIVLGGVIAVAATVYGVARSSDAVAVDVRLAELAHARMLEQQQNATRLASGLAPVFSDPTVALDGRRTWQRVVAPLAVAGALGGAGVWLYNKKKAAPRRRSPQPSRATQRYRAVLANPKRGRRTVAKPKRRRAAKATIKARALGGRVRAPARQAVTIAGYLGKGTKAGRLVTRWAKSRKPSDPELQSFLYATDQMGAPRDFAAADALAARAWKRPAKYVTRNNPTRKRNPPARKPTTRKKKNPAASRCKKCTTKGKCAAHAKAADFGHDKRPAKYKGLRRDAFGYPARWMYPLNTPQRTRAAARFYGQYCDRYPPAMRKELARNIDKAEKKHGIGKYAKKPNPKARRRAPGAGGRVATRKRARR